MLPELPEALRFRAVTDDTYVGSYQNIHQPYGYTDPKKIEQLRAGIASVHQSRADEIVVAYDAWTAACDAARQAVGLPEAEDTWNRTRDAEVALRRRIVGTPAANAEDLRLKAEVAVWCFGTMADVEGDLAQAMREGFCGDTTASTAVLLDVVRLLDADAMPAAAVPTSNLRPVSLSRLAFPAGLYPAGTSREEIKTYRTFLEMELRFLNHEVYGQTEGRLHFWLDNPAGSFHGGGEPQPSTRARAVLSLLGLMPGTADAVPLPAASAA